MAIPKDMVPIVAALRDAARATGASCVAAGMFTAAPAWARLVDECDAQLPPSPPSKDEPKPT